MDRSAGCSGEDLQPVDVRCSEVGVEREVVVGLVLGHHTGLLGQRSYLSGHHFWRCSVFL